MNILEISGLRKSYRQENRSIEVLKGVSLALPEGRLKVLLGRSGSGKTTLLMICAGYEKPDEGQVLFCGTPLSGASPDRFMVFQTFDQLYPWLSVKDNIAFALRNTARRLSKHAAEETAMQLLCETGLAGFENAWPASLSGGMKQRAALARAFALRPKLLLLDEPFAALDAVLRKSMQQLLMDLCDKRNVSALFVTHDIEEALCLDSSPFVLGHDGAQIHSMAGRASDRQSIIDLLSIPQSSASMPAHAK